MYNIIIDFVLNRIEGIEKPKVVTWNNDTFANYPDENIILVPEENLNLNGLKNDFYINFLVPFIYKQYNFKLPEDNVIVFCMLHEIGHILTMRGMNADIIYDINEKLHNNINNELSDYELDVLYRLNPFEIMADSWAMSFILMHPEILEIKDNIILN